MNNRNIILLLILILALGAASTASAGGSIFAGVNFPTGNFDNGAKTGWTGGAYYTADLLPIVDIGGLLAYNNFSTSITDVDLDNALGGSYDAWEIHALGQLKFLMLKGFLGLGLANYKGIDANPDNTLDSSRKTDFSWQMGLAMKIAVLEARLGYHQIPVDGGSINWMKLTVGLGF